MNVEEGFIKNAWWSDKEDCQFVLHNWTVEGPVKLLHHAVPVWDCSIFTSFQLFSYLSDCGFPRCLLLGPTGTNYVKIPTARNYTTGNCSGSYEEDDAGHIKWNPGCEPGFAPLPDPCVDLNYAVVEKKGGGVKEEVGDVSKKALSDRAINDINDTLHVFIRKTILSIFCCK